MSIELVDSRQLSEEVLEALRLRALRACELGHTQAEVAEILGVARETVSRWWVAYQEDGLDGLPHERTGRPLGSGRLLTDDQAQRIQDLITTHTPEQLDIPSPLWSREAVRELIAKEFNIDLAVRTVGEYLKRWGFTAKKPNRHSRHQDPEEVQDWLEETYPAIEELAQQENAEIHWADETGVAADQHPGLGYAPKGQESTMEVPDSHKRVNVISSITNEGHLFFIIYKEMMDAELFVIFLEELLKTTDKKIFLIVDQLSAHDCKKVEDWLAEKANDRLELFFLPAHYPEGDVVEYLNQDMKAEVHAEGLPENQDQLLSHVQAFLLWLLKTPERVRAYFQHPEVAYAAGAV
jgi:transposase